MYTYTAGCSHSFGDFCGDQQPTSWSTGTTCSSKFATFSLLTFLKVGKGDDDDDELIRPKVAERLTSSIEPLQWSEENKQRF